MALQYHLPENDSDLHTVQLRTTPDGTISSTGIQREGLPAEWYPQSAVQLTWPHKGTDWAPILKEVTTCYIRMALEIALREHLVVVTPEPEEVEKLFECNLPQQARKNISLIKIDSNDTWTRDHGFITVLSDNGAKLLDFQFNGWGKKFEAALDNQICRKMMDKGILKGTYCNHLDFVLEGGSIESDGMGTIMTTRHCLMAPHRNQPMTQEEIEKRLLEVFNAQRILWLEYGYLAGDDTDSHIDTLARLCPNDTIAYVQCTDPEDEHYSALLAMEQQLKTFRTTGGQPYRLIPLPMAAPAYDEKGCRLPATYANFLIINGAVLMPTYENKELDEKAKKQLQKAFPKHEIIGINCLALIEQHGSLHCCTMQFPKGVMEK